MSELEQARSQKEIIDRDVETAGKDVATLQDESTEEIEKNLQQVEMINARFERMRNTRRQSKKQNGMGMNMQSLQESWSGSVLTAVPSLMALTFRFLGSLWKMASSFIRAFPGMA